MPPFAWEVFLFLQQGPHLFTPCPVSWHWRGKKPYKPKQKKPKHEEDRWTLFSTPAWWERCHTATEPSLAQVTAMLHQAGLQRTHSCSFSAAPSRAQQAEMVQRCLFLKCFNVQQHKNKNKSLWRVINEQSWLIVRLLTWSHIMLSPKYSYKRSSQRGPYAQDHHRCWLCPFLQFCSSS